MEPKRSCASRVRLEDARVDAEQRDLAGIGVGDRLEDERRVRLVDRPPSLGRRMVLRVLPPEGAALPRVRQVGDAGVEERVRPDVRQSGDAQHGKDLPLPDPAREARDQVLLGERAALEELLHEGVVHLGDHLHERVARLLDRRRHIGGDVGELVPAAVVLLVEEGLVRDQVHDAREGLFGPERDLNRHRLASEGPDDRFKSARERGVLAIDLVDHEQARELELLGVSPRFFGLHLDARHPVHDDEGAVQDAQGGLGVRDEGAVAGRIDDVELDLLPLQVAEGGRDRHLAGDLLLVEVGDRVPLVDPAETVDGAGGEQERGREGRLSGGAVTDDADIADFGNLIQLHARIPSTRARHFPAFTSS